MAAKVFVLAYLLQVVIMGNIFGRVVEVQLRESLYGMGGHHGGSKGSTDGEVRVSRSNLKLQQIKKKKHPYCSLIETFVDAGFHRTPS